MTLARLYAIFALFCASITTTLATGIIVPLYSWPGNSASTCTAWTALITAIAAHPSVTFFVIVNPDSGPGKTNTQPDPVYSGCMQKLKASNVVLVGYVDTQNAKRASSAIIQDILTYAEWNSAYAVSGFFFDDVTASKKLFTDYSGWAATAKQSFKGGNGLESISDNDYFTIADQIMTFEDEYSNFSESDMTFSSASPASKQSVILYAAPSTVPSSIVSDLVTTNGIASLYITNLGSDDPYANLPAKFASFVSTVAADS